MNAEDRELMELVVNERVAHALSQLAAFVGVALLVLPSLFNLLFAFLNADPVSVPLNLAFASVAFVAAAVLEWRAHTYREQYNHRTQPIEQVGHTTAAEEAA